MSKENKKDRQCSNCGIHKSQHFFGRMDRRCPGPEEEDFPIEIPTDPSTDIDPKSTPSESLNQQDQLSTMDTEIKEEEEDPPPQGFEKVEVHYWEAADKDKKRQPVNKHTGIYAYHADDCLCSMAGWPCFRDGAIWSCCGENEQYCLCTKPEK